MPAKKTTTKTSTKKVIDLTEMDETSPEVSPKAASSPMEKVTLETLHKDNLDLKDQVAELLLVVGSLSNSLVSPATDLTKVAPKKPKVETTFNWFKSRVQKDNALLEAILKGNNPELWSFGEYKTKFRGEVKQVSGGETDEVRKKAAHTLWVKCFGKEEQEYIKEYRNKVDPPEVTTKSKKKKCVLFSEDEDEPAAAAAEAPSKPAPKKAAPKKATTLATNLSLEDDKSNDSNSQEEDDDESD